jgi:hypothetical protein
MTVWEILLGQRGSQKHFGIGVAKAAAQSQSIGFSIGDNYQAG